MADLSEENLRRIKQEAKNAEEAVKAYQRAIEQANKKAEKHLQAWDSISNALFGIAGNDFFREVEKSAAEMSEISNRIDIIKDEFYDINKIIETSNPFVQLQADVANYGDKLMMVAKQGQGIFSGINDVKVREGLAHAIKYNNVVGFIQQHGEKAIKALENLHIGGESFKKHIDDILQSQGNEIKSVKELIASTKELAITEHQFYNERTRKVIDFGQAVDKISKNLYEKISFKNIVSYVGTFDQKLADINKKFNLTRDDFKFASQAMGELIQSGAQFGVTTEDAFSNVEELGNTIRSTNIPVLASYAKELQAIPKAFGVAREEAMNLAGTFIFYGKSISETKDFFSKIAVQSKIYGVNVSKVTSEIAKSLPKWKQMGFREGEASLARMAAKAEKLGIKIESIIDSADKMQDLEATMEGAANLNVLGGSFSQFNPLQILGAATEGVDAYQEMLVNLGRDIGNINAKGDFEINFIDKKRLKAAADSLGVTYDEYFKLLSQARVETEKQNKLSQFSFFGGLDSDDKKMLMNYVQLDGKGIKITGLDGISGINDLRQLTAEDIKNRLKSQSKEVANIEAQAKARQSLKETFDSFVNQFMSAFVVFEPAIKFLTATLQKVIIWVEKFNKFLNEHFGDNAKWIKTFVSTTTLLALLFGPRSLIALIFSPKGILVQGLMGLKGMFSGVAKNIFGKGGAAIPLKTPGGGGGIKGFLSGLALGLEEWGIAGATAVKGAAYLAAAIAIISLPLLGITYVIGQMGGDFTLGKLVAFGLGLGMFAIALSGASQISQTINLTNFAKFSLALALIGTALSIPVAIIGALGGDWNISKLIAFGMSLGIFAGSITLATRLSSAINYGGLLKFSGALALIGLSLSGMTYLLSIAKPATLGSVLGLLESLGIAALSIIVASKLSNQINLVGIGQFALAITAIGAAFGLFGLLTSKLKALSLDVITQTLIPAVLSVALVSRLSGSISNKNWLNFILAFTSIGAGLAIFSQLMTRFGSVLSGDILISMAESLLLFVGSVVVLSKISGSINNINLGKLVLSFGLIGAGLAIFSRLISEFGSVLSKEMLVTTGSSLLMLVGSMFAVSKISGQINNAGLLNMSIAMGIISGGLFLFGKAVKNMGGVTWNQLGMVGASLVGLMTSLMIMSNIPINVAGILSGSIAMGIISLALYPFAKTMKLFNDVNWGSLLKAGVSIVGLASILAGLAFFSPLIFVGAGVLAAASVSLVIFGAGMLVVGKAMQTLSSVDWKAVGLMGDSLLSVGKGVAVGAAAGLIALPGLALLSLGLATFAISMKALSPSLIAIIPLLNQLASVNWGGLSGVGGIMAGFAVGLLPLALVGGLSGTINKATSVIKNIGDAVGGIVSVPFKSLSNIGDYLGELSWGLTKLSVGGLFSGGVDKAANQIKSLAVGLDLLSKINFTSLSNFDTYTGIVKKGINDLNNLEFKGGSSNIINQVSEDFKKIGNVFGSVVQLTASNINMSNVIKPIDELLSSINNIASSSVNKSADALNDTLHKLSFALSNINGISVNAVSLNNIVGAFKAIHDSVNYAISMSSGMSVLNSMSESLNNTWKSFINGMTAFSTINKSAISDINKSIGELFASIKSIPDFSIIYGSLIKSSNAVVVFATIHKNSVSEINKSIKELFTSLNSISDFSGVYDSINKVYGAMMQSANVLSAFGNSNKVIVSEINKSISEIYASLQSIPDFSSVYNTLIQYSNAIIAFGETSKNALFGVNKAIYDLIGGLNSTADFSTVNNSLDKISGSLIATGNLISKFGGIGQTVVSEINKSVGGLFLALNSVSDFSLVNSALSNVYNSLQQSSAAISVFGNTSKNVISEMNKTINELFLSLNSLPDFSVFYDFLIQSTNSISGFGDKLSSAYDIASDKAKSFSATIRSLQTDIDALTNNSSKTIAAGVAVGFVSTMFTNLASGFSVLSGIDWGILSTISISLNDFAPAIEKINVINWAGMKELVFNMLQLGSFSATANKASLALQNIGNSVLSISTIPFNVLGNIGGYLNILSNGFSNLSSGKMFTENADKITSNIMSIGNGLNVLSKINFSVLTNFDAFATTIKNGLNSLNSIEFNTGNEGIVNKMANSMVVFASSISKLFMLDLANNNGLANFSNSINSFFGSLNALAGSAVQNSAQIISDVFYKLNSAINQASSVMFNETAFQNMSNSFKAVYGAIEYLVKLNSSMDVLKNMTNTLNSLGTNFVSGVSAFGNINISTVDSIKSSVSSLLSTLKSIADFSVFYEPIVKSSSGFYILGNSLMSVTRVVADKIQNFGIAVRAIVNELPSLIQIGDSSKAIQLAGVGIGVLGSVFLASADGFIAISNVNWESLSFMAKGLNDLYPSLNQFSTLGSSIGLYVVARTMASFGQIATSVAAPVQLVAESIGMMADNINRLSIAANNLNANKFREIATLSDKMFTKIAPVAISTNSDYRNAEKEKSELTIKFKPIDLKLNGRDLQQIQIEDIKYLL